MLLYELLAGLEYRLFGIDADCDISRPFSDSRSTVFGGLFLCLRGSETDGHNYVDEVKRKGGKAAVADHYCEGIPCVLVEDTRYASAVIWNNYYKRPASGMRLYGITGTNGKTSTAAFLASCLEADGRVVGTLGTFGAAVGDEKSELSGTEKADTAASMTTPDPEYLYGALAYFREKGVTDAVLEVSSHSILQRKVDALQFDVGVFTNLSPEHLDFHKDMEEYFRVKASFVSRCTKRVVNCDDPYGGRFSQRIPSVCVSRSLMNDISVSNDRVGYSLKIQDCDVRIESGVGGEFSLYNTALAVCSAFVCGVRVEAIQKGIRKVRCICGRMEKVVGADKYGFELYIDYAHTPAALEGVLCQLRRSCPGRLICVFGCGGERDRQKRPLMGRAAEYLADAVIVTSDNPRGEESLSVIKDIVKGMTGKNSVVIPDRKEAVFAAVSMAQRGDTILLAGKGHEKYEIGPAGKRRFDERDVVKEALRLKYGK